MSAIKGEHDKLLVGPISDGLPSIVTAAHELKAPLALVRQLSLMLEDAEIDNLERQRMLQQITLTSERALRLTSDLTKVSRLQDAMFQVEPINPKQLCEDIIAELTPLFAAHGRELRLAKRCHPLLLIANRDLLRRIMMNFSDNALYYSDGATLIEMNIGALNNGQTIRLGVRDYGPALPADVLREIKSRSGLVSKVINARPQSSGLGIYIAGQFADAMDGKIGVIRHRDGVTFYVDLQASQQMSLL